MERPNQGAGTVDRPSLTWQVRAGPQQPTYTNRGLDLPTHASVHSFIPCGDSIRGGQGEEGDRKEVSAGFDVLFPGRSLPRGPPRVPASLPLLHCCPCSALLLQAVPPGHCLSSVPQWPTDRRMRSRRWLGRLSFPNLSWNVSPHQTVGSKSVLSAHLAVELQACME